ncbi:MAG: hypothetical protein OJF49_004240 [Ktedonobacterales bacterium]|jgi:hypothetical protein|nr:MAG: hypothetical protein OJF49_004240 [Ktedonobacterales bacterium]
MSMIDTLLQRNVELDDHYDAITQLDGAAFLHLAAGFVAGHKAHFRRWDFAWLHHALRDSVSFCIASSEERR